MIFRSKPINTSGPHAQGFTLIELLIVLVILGISISLLAPDMYGSFKRAQVKNEISSIKMISQLAIERSFFSNSIVEISFDGNLLNVTQILDSNPDKNTKNEEQNNSVKLQTITSEFFLFEEKKFLINRGKWQNIESITLKDSPYENLKEIELIDCEETRAC